MIFKVKVNKVNTSILRGKGKTFKGQYGFRKDVKRAIVTLQEGNTIDSSPGDKIMLNKFKPTTPGLRGTVLVSKKDLSNEKPLNHLTKN